LLIHRLSEDKNKAWETRQETQATFIKFLNESLGLNRNSITLADIHRLPQNPVYKDSDKVDRPIIFKLTNAFDKYTISSRLKHLKAKKEKKQQDARRSSKMLKRRSKMQNGQFEMVNIVFTLTGTKLKCSYKFKMQNNLCFINRIDNTVYKIIIN